MNPEIEIDFPFYKEQYFGNGQESAKWTRQIYCADILKDQSTVSAAGGTDVATENLLKYVSSNLLPSPISKRGELSSNISIPGMGSHNLTSAGAVRDFEVELVKYINSQRNQECQIREYNNGVDIYDMFFKDAGKHSHLLDDGIPQILITTPSSFSDPASSFTGTNTKPSFYWPPPGISVIYKESFVDKLTGYTGDDNKFYMSIQQGFTETANDTLNRKPGFNQRYILHQRPPNSIIGTAQKVCTNAVCPPVLNNQDLEGHIVEMLKPVVDVNHVNRSDGYGPLLSSNAQIINFRDVENAIASMSKEFGDTLQPPIIVIFNELYDEYGGDPDIQNLINRMNGVPSAAEWNPSGIFKKFCDSIEVEYIEGNGQIKITLIGLSPDIQPQPDSNKSLKNVFITVDLCVLFKGFSSGYLDMHYTGTSSDFREKYFPTTTKLSKKEKLILHIKNLTSKCTVQLDIIKSLAVHIKNANMIIRNDGLNVGGDKYNMLIFVMHGNIARNLQLKYRRGTSERINFVIEELNSKKYYYSYILNTLEGLKTFIDGESDKTINGIPGSIDEVLYRRLSTTSGIGNKWLASDRSTYGPCHLLDPDELFSVSKKRVTDSIRENTLVSEYTYDINKQTTKYKMPVDPIKMKEHYSNDENRSIMDMEIQGGKFNKQQYGGVSNKLYRINILDPDSEKIPYYVLTGQNNHKLDSIIINSNYIPQFPTPYKFIKSVAKFFKDKDLNLLRLNIGSKKKTIKKKKNKKSKKIRVDLKGGVRKSWVRSSRRSRSRSRGRGRSKSPSRITRDSGRSRSESSSYSKSDEGDLSDQKLNWNDSEAPEFDEEGIIYDILMNNGIENSIKKYKDMFISDCKSIFDSVRVTHESVYEKIADKHVKNFIQHLGNIFEIQEKYYSLSTIPSSKTLNKFSTYVAPPSKKSTPSSKKSTPIKSKKSTPEYPLSTLIKSKNLKKITKFKRRLNPKKSFKKKK